MYICVCVCGVVVQVDRILPHSYHRYVKLVRRLCSLLKVTSASAGQLCFISILTLAPSPTPAPAPSSSPAELQLRASCYRTPPYSRHEQTKLGLENRSIGRDVQWLYTDNNGGKFSRHSNCWTKELPCILKYSGVHIEWCFVDICQHTLVEISVW